MPLAQEGRGLTFLSRVLGRGCPAWVKGPVHSKSQAWDSSGIKGHLTSPLANFYSLIQEIGASGMSVTLVESEFGSRWSCLQA